MQVVRFIDPHPFPFAEFLVRILSDPNRFPLSHFAVHDFLTRLLAIGLWLQKPNQTLSNSAILKARTSRFKFSPIPNSTVVNTLDTLNTPLIFLISFEQLDIYATFPKEWGSVNAVMGTW
jgi:hypothetical protein